MILYCRLHDHHKALRVLAVTLNDVNASIRYCKKHAGHEGFIALLDMLLNPGEGRDPMYTEACQVIFELVGIAPSSSGNNLSF